MILGVYSVFDNVAQAFLPPFYMANDGLAVRALANAVNDPEHQFAKNSGDYQLFKIASFDDSTGVIDPITKFENLGLASAWLGK